MLSLLSISTSCYWVFTVTQTKMITFILKLPPIYMKRILLLLSLLVACILGRPAAARAQSTALQFNDRIAYISDSLYSKGRQWGIMFVAARSSKDFASLKPSREALERFIGDKIKEVTNMKDVKNSKPLRMAMIGFLSYEGDMVAKAFRPLESLKSTATEAEIEAALDKLTELSKNEAGELAKLSAAQEAYARDNGFAIQAAKEEGKN